MSLTKVEDNHSTKIKDRGGSVRMSLDKKICNSNNSNIFQPNETLWTMISLTLYVKDVDQDSVVLAI